MKKKLLFLLFLGGLMATVEAQQLANYGFNGWKSECASTEALNKDGSEMRQRPGAEPTDWNGSSVNQKVSGVTKKQELVYNDGSTVKMVNTFVGVKILWYEIGSVAPGFITLCTPWVYAVTDVGDCDGGVYGGVNFSYKPDAITGRYRRTDATGEKSHIIVYLWNGTYTSKVGSKSSPSYLRDNVGRAIMGKSTPTASGTLVASCDYEFTATTNKDWQTITVPLNYAVDATVNPTMMNTIISGGDYWNRGVMKENTTLYTDDVRFVYYSTLKSLSYDGEALTVPEAGAVLDMSSVIYDESKLFYTLNGQTATATASYDDASSILTIVVSNVDNDIDGQSSHTYYVQFAKEHLHGTYKYTSDAANITVTCGECGESLGTISMVLPSDLIYDGKAKVVTLIGPIQDMEVPVVVYSCGEAPVNVGKYTATIQLGDATTSIEFSIDARDIAGAVVGDFVPMTYIGKAQTPMATVTLDGYGEITGTWGEVVNVDDVAIFVANGNFTGTVSAPTGMAPAVLVEPVVEGVVDSYEYTGSTIQPDVLVKNGDTILVEGIDYVVSFENNIEAGAGTVIITFIGNYSGTLTLTFEIIDTAVRHILQNEEKVYYDLLGRRVKKPLEGGLYIVNGRKVCL